MRPATASVNRSPCCEKGNNYGYFVFSIPKNLRSYFLYNQKLSADPWRFAWKSLMVF